MIILEISSSSCSNGSAWFDLRKFMMWFPHFNPLLNLSLVTIHSSLVTITYHVSYFLLFFCC
jgi:hypothetical protein